MSAALAVQQYEPWETFCVQREDEQSEADEELELVLDALEDRAKLCVRLGDDHSALELRDIIARLKEREHR
jgi:hypothetical protein